MKVVSLFINPVICPLVCSRHLTLGLQFAVLQSLVCSPQSVVYLTAQRTLYNNQISADALIGQSAMVYCAILGMNSPAARNLRILLVFYQHPSGVYQPINNSNLWSIA